MPPDPAPAAPAPNPLQALLHRAAAAATDPAVKQWLTAMSERAEYVSVAAAPAPARPAEAPTAPPG